MAFPIKDILSGHIHLKTVLLNFIDPIQDVILHISSPIYCLYVGIAACTHHHDLFRKSNDKHRSESTNKKSRRIRPYFVPKMADDVTGATESVPEPLLFFNYHEFVVAGDPQTSKLASSKSLVVTHFPNNHASLSGSSYTNTRIVRIPRAYEGNPMSDIIPQFSIYTPGLEPAALNHPSGDQQFHVVGQFDGNFFGETSSTPLVPSKISSEELRQIVSTVNDMLFAAYNPHNLWNFVDNVLDFLTATVYSYFAGGKLYNTYSKRCLVKLEEFILYQNEVLAPRDVQIISPRRCGYLLLDFQVVRPTGEL